MNRKWRLVIQRVSEGGAVMNEEELAYDDMDTLARAALAAFNAAAGMEPDDIEIEEAEQ